MAHTETAIRTQGFNYLYRDDRLVLKTSFDGNANKCLILFFKINGVKELKIIGRDLISNRLNLTVLYQIDMAYKHVNVYGDTCFINREAVY